MEQASQERLIVRESPPTRRSLGRRFGRVSRAKLFSREYFNQLHNASTG